MSSIEHHIAQLAADGVRINIWPTKSGEFQANVSEQAGRAWTCHTAPTALEALSVALRLRATGASGREVVFEDDITPPTVAIDATTSSQIDLEEAIAATTTDDFEDLL